MTVFHHDCVEPSAEVKIENRKGLCVTAKVHCKSCNFVSDACSLFTEVSLENVRGPKSGTLNDALA